eukprot:CAMPEP_0118680398 /NCGR_PEP_ID=MMETSP0800-20121206/4343_1 /TAXON_ID=210618 ORGANISM="Striatella unipunctata, Strain CCMP2910" /NCGR_SAMPLE_ID=MMETSP0800 /ASSEMBLY_ACC=CAM_ASM_000638 /LENGTH=610 /DNA_ID=CAMNT_0006576543 /DNA_START=166 /DNA_END=1998 /DNA_ORIENTATION=+
MLGLLKRKPSVSTNSISKKNSKTLSFSTAQSFDPTSSSSFTLQKDASTKDDQLNTSIDFLQIYQDKQKDKLINGLLPAQEAERYNWMDADDGYRSRHHHHHHQQDNTNGNNNPNKQDVSCWDRVDVSSICVGVCLVFIIAVFVCVPVLIFLGGGSQDLAAFGMEEYRDVLVNISLDASLFENINTPQYKATDFLMYQDVLQLDPTTPEALIQRYAIMVLYFSTVTIPNKLDMWRLDQEECLWEFVECENGEITMLTLDEVFEGGSRIPMELGMAFDKLQYLSMSKNGFKGTLPPSFYRLTNLQYLDLHENLLESPLDESIGRLFVQLQTLDLHENSFSGSLPSTIANLENLVSLRLGSNFFKSEVLDTIIMSLTNLEHLELSNNRFSGTIPYDLTMELSSLTSLDLGENAFFGDFELLPGDDAPLKNLVVQGNALFGTFPNFIGNFTNLEILRFGNCNVAGSIPPELGRLEKLHTLSIESNKLTGSIPTSLGLLSALRVLWLDKNRLEGSIPTEIGNLRKLTSIYFQSNEFQNTLPTELGLLTDLYELFADINRFTGTFPTELTQLTNLEYLTLSFNRIDAPTPPEMCSIDLIIYEADCDDECECCTRCW